MRILAMSRSLPGHPGAGGMEQIADDLMREWHGQGHEVICLTTPGVDPTAFPYRVEVLPGRPGRSTRGWRRALSTRSAELPHDVIFSVSAAAHGAVVRRSAVPVVMQAHGTALRELRTKLRSGRPLDLLRAARKTVGLIADLRNYRRYAAVVAVNRAVAAALAEFPRPVGPQSVPLVENGVRPAPTGPRRGGTPEPVIGFVGRLHREKGADLVVDASARAGWDVVVVGGGPEERSLRAGAPDGSRFTGALPHDAVLAELRSIDVLVAPSRHAEGLTLTVLEALAAGVPVVVSEAMTAGYDGDLPPGVVIAQGGVDGIVTAVREARRTVAELPADRTVAACAVRYTELFEEVRRRG